MLLPMLPSGTGGAVPTRQRHRLPQAELASFPAQVHYPEREKRAPAEDQGPALHLRMHVRHRVPGVVAGRSVQGGADQQAVGGFCAGVHHQRRQLWDLVRTRPGRQAEGLVDGCLFPHRFHVL